MEKMTDDKMVDGHKVSSVILAPFSIAWRRRLQTGAVALLLFSFTLLPIVCWLVPLYVAFYSKYWPVAAVYLLWYVSDFQTPHQGGRISEFVRSMRYWTWSAEYFPITLHKTVDLDPTRNYVFGYHPHGIICLGALHSFGVSVTGFRDKFPGLRSRLVMLDFWFKIPMFREYIMNALIPHQKKSIQNYINKSPSGGQVACLVVGGAPEALLAKPGKPEIILNARKGFIKLAIQLGTDLVPVFGFGENDIWDQDEQPKEGTFAHKFNTAMTKNLGIVMPAFSGRGIFNYNRGLLPHRRPIHVVVGEPIQLEKVDNPSREQVAKLHATYVTALQKLYDTHASKYVPRTEEGQIQTLKIN